jgi:hypothetical protein
MSSPELGRAIFVSYIHWHLQILLQPGFRARMNPLKSVFAREVTIVK